VAITNEIMNQTRINNEKADGSSRLSGKVALVTGGSRGIGAGIVKRLAREKADVAFTFLKENDDAESVVKEASTNGNQVVAMQADSGNAGELTKAIDKVVKRFGRIDILVSSAGAFLFKPVDKISEEEFDHMVAVDLKAAFIASRAVLEHMPDGGRIVFISSNIADFAALATTSIYSMVKAGLDGLAKGMARDLGPRGITVNTVHPGPIKTDGNPEDSPYARDLRSFMVTPDYGEPADVAAMVAFLVSPEAKFATGAAFVIDHGFTA
jgi:3-oxoacyl-[acyl-carrier protein] reductase